MDPQMAAHVTLDTEFAHATVFWADKGFLACVRVGVNAER